MHPLAVALTTAVDGVIRAVQAVSTGLGDLSEDEALELLVTLVAQSGRLSVASARLSTTVDDDGLWATEGARSFAHWLAAGTGMSFAKARDVVATGRALRDHLPATAVAGLAGDVPVEQVATLAKLAPTSEARRAVLAAPAAGCGEEVLLAEARVQPADCFRRLVRRWAAAADPQADERGYRQACEREFVALAPTLDGWHLAGFLTTEHGALFAAALDGVMTPPAADDARSYQQRRAQAVADVSRLVLENGLVGTGSAVRPHLSVVVDFDTLRRAVLDDREAAESERRADENDHRADEDDCRSDETGTSFRRVSDPPRPECLFRLSPVADVERFAVAEVLGAGPIPAGVLARLACDSEVSRIVFGPDSQVINAGRAERTFSGPRRKAVIARDGTCRYPGCTAPPALGEIHHVEQWARDHGETDINLGILLCWHHHDLVHRLHIEIRRSPTGGWLFLTRHGDPVAASV